MEITVGREPVDGMAEMIVDYYEQIDGYGWGGRVNVWVHWSDSHQEMQDAAKKAAKSFLERALSAHS